MGRKKHAAVGVIVAVLFFWLLFYSNPLFSILKGIHQEDGVVKKSCFNADFTDIRFDGSKTKHFDNKSANFMTCIRLSFGLRAFNNLDCKDGLLKFEPKEISLCTA